MHLNRFDVVVKDFKVILRKSNYYYATTLEASAKLELEALLPVLLIGIQSLAVA